MASSVFIGWFGGAPWSWNGSTGTFTGNLTVTGDFSSDAGAFTTSSTAVTSTVPFLGPDGTAGAPSLSFATHGSDDGVYHPGDGIVGVATQGLGRFGFNGRNFALGADGTVGWSDTNDNAFQTIDVSLSRGAANRLDLASGDSFRLVDGALIGGSATGTLVTNDGQVVANDAVISLGTNAVQGYLVVDCAEDDDSGLFVLRGAAEAVAEINDTGGLFTVTKDNASTINIYWDAGNSRYELQNKRGGNRTIRLVRLGV